MSSIVGRFLNYFLVPLYTSKFAPSDYGITTEFYAYVAFLIVLLTYGLETALFRFYLQKDTDKPKVFATAMVSITVSSVAFMLLSIVLASPIANALEYPGHADYVIWFALILGFDAITAIPFAKLRADNCPLAFAGIKLVNIFLNIGLNVFFIAICKPAFEANQGSWLASVYNPSIGVGYMFLSNLAASALTLLMMLPMYRSLMAGFDKQLWKEMIAYGAPMIFVGLASIINETFGRAMLKYWLPYDNATNLHMLGVYGACYKLAALMSIFIQAYRYAAEPFFFAKKQDSDAKYLYARTFDYFSVFSLFLFLAVTLCIDLFKLFIRNPAYYEGLGVVPILLMANLFLGMYVNLSIWFKFTDKTRMGAVVAVGGAIITLGMNILLIPLHHPVFGGYMGSAWATLVTYCYMAVISYVMGQKYYPVNYQIGRAGAMIVFTLGLYFVDKFYVPLLPIHPYISKAFLLAMFFLIAATGYGIKLRLPVKQ
ncbi:MAG: polysaccharide biosynthesis C-terminal domain-containing protein [Chitinophagales bacterium]|nr:polysaccharide biosynthesis C-terminal domain-containing protein [Chitinophagales bacterium]